MYYEGTKDYVAATPALITTFRASGSISAGRCVVFVGDDSSDVYQPTGLPSGSVLPVGVAIQTVSTTDPVAVLVWGHAKNLPLLGGAVTPGSFIVNTGSGYWGTSGSTMTNPLYRLATVAGKCVSGSAASGKITAFINCM